MESQSSPPPEAVPQRLHLFPAGLSLVCPGLGQLVQGRPVFLCHVITWILVVATWVPFFPVLWEFWANIWAVSRENFANGYGFINDAIEIPLILFLLVLSLLPPLFLILFVLFAVLDAATWEREKPPRFKKQFAVLIVLFIPLSAFYGLLIPALPAAREAAKRMTCTGAAKPLCLALHNYHDIYGSFPPAYTADENGKPLHSWRVLLLPYIEQQRLYDKIRLDEPWDSEYNQQFHEVQIGTFQCPTRRDEMSSARKTCNVFVKNRELLRTANCDYSVVIGEDTTFPGTTTVTYNDITDKKSETILVVERMIPVNWMAPNNEIRFDVASQGVNRNLLGIGSEHWGRCGAWIGFADGSIKFLDETTDIEPLLTKSAGD